MAASCHKVHLYTWLIVLVLVCVRASFESRFTLMGTREDTWMLTLTASINKPSQWGRRDIITGPLQWLDRKTKYAWIESKTKDPKMWCKRWQRCVRSSGGRFVSVPVHRAVFIWLLCTGNSCIFVFRIGNFTFWWIFFSEPILCYSLKNLPNGCLVLRPKSCGILVPMNYGKVSWGA